MGQDIICCGGRGDKANLSQDEDAGTYLSNIQGHSEWESELQDDVADHEVDEPGMLEGTGKKLKAQVSS